MSARLPRRSFAKPFVVTLAAAPLAVGCGGPKNKTPVLDNPPAPDKVVKPPVESEQRWTVSNTKGTCRAFQNIECPKPEGDQPVPTCNPPPPIDYACPEGMLNDGESMQLVLRGGECWVDYGEIDCPPEAACNPPPPQQLPCPKR